MRSKFLSAFTILLFTGGSLLADVSLTAVEDGVKISGGGIGPFTLLYPIHVTDDHNVALKPEVKVRPDGLGADLTYSTGLNVKVFISKDDDTVSYTLGDIPAHAQYLNFEMDVPVSGVPGGQVSMDGKPVNLPLSMGELKLLNGAFQEMDLTGSSGTGFSLKTLPNFMMLEDHRVLGGPFFVYEYHYFIQADPGRHKLTLSFTEAKKKP